MLKLRLFSFLSLDKFIIKMWDQAIDVKNHRNFQASLIIMHFI